MNGNRGFIMLSTNVAFRMIATDMERSLARTAGMPAVARESENYLSRIGEIGSVEEFIADDRVFSYAMEAFGLGDMTYAKAFMRKILEQGTDRPDSLANRLSDARYREFAETFNFARHGEATTVFDRTRQGVVDRHVRHTLEENAGARNEGVRLALYFKRKAPGIESPMDILADPALLKVVQTAIGLSPLTAAADIDRQAEMIAERLDVAELKDPEALQDFLTRFSSFWDMAHAPPSIAPSLLSGQGQFGVSPDLLLSLQRLKLGGI